MIPTLLAKGSGVILRRRRLRCRRGRCHRRCRRRRRCRRHRDKTRGLIESDAEVSDGCSTRADQDQDFLSRMRRMKRKPTTTKFARQESFRNKYYSGLRCFLSSSDCSFSTSPMRWKLFPLRNFLRELDFTPRCLLGEARAKEEKNCAGFSGLFHMDHQF